MSYIDTQRSEVRSTERSISDAVSVAQRHEQSQKFSGLVEIHITVDPENNFVKLWQFTKENDCKLIYTCATEGVHPNQYMISKFTNKYSLDDMFIKLNTMKKLLREKNIKIIRCKMELMAGVEGIPNTEEEYIKLCDIFARPYFEFHVKIAGDYDEINKLCKKFNGVAVSVNICGKDKDILLTIRQYSCKKEAVEYKNRVLDFFKEAKYKLRDEIQQEFCFFDDNRELDNNWLT